MLYEVKINIAIISKHVLTWNMKLYLIKTYKSKNMLIKIAYTLLAAVWNIVDACKIIIKHLTNEIVIKWNVLLAISNNWQYNRKW